MILLGDVIVIFLSIIAFVYGIIMLITSKRPLYFQLVMASVGCHILGYLFDICEFFVTDVLYGGYLIGYFGTIGCFLFLLTASFGYMDGIIDDKTPQIKKSRIIALIAPVFTLLLFIPNVLSDISVGRKIVYSVLWITASFSSYFNLKHAIVFDMGFGFVKAIRPFNVSALFFTFCQLIHLTLWNYGNWILLLFSGILFGCSCIAMIITADKGIKKWVL